MRARTAASRKSKRAAASGKSERYRFSVLFIEDAAGWSAQVLEHDIATQAGNLEDLFYEVERILTSHIVLASVEGRSPFKDIPPAPQPYWDMYRNAAIFMGGRRAGLRQKQSAPPKISSRIRIAARPAA